MWDGTSANQMFPINEWNRMNMEHEVWNDWQYVIPACYQYCSEWATNVCLTRWNVSVWSWTVSPHSSRLLKMDLSNYLWSELMDVDWNTVGLSLVELKSVEEYQQRFNGWLKKDLLSWTLELVRAMVTSGQGIRFDRVWLIDMEWMVAVLFDESFGIKILCLTSDYISCEECY
jgi:hypothetical protein